MNIFLNLNSQNRVLHLLIKLIYFICIVKTDLEVRIGTLDEYNYGPK